MYNYFTKLSLEGDHNIYVVKFKLKFESIYDIETKFSISLLVYSVHMIFSILLANNKTCKFVRFFNFSNISISSFC